MDKLDLDARMARLERRVGLLSTVMLLAGVGLGVALSLGLLALRATHARVAVATPAVPAPILAAPAMPGMALRPAEPIGFTDHPMGFMGGADDGSMPALHQKLTSLKQLHDEGLVADPEWEAMRTRAIEAPITSGDLRSDLQTVQRLFDAGAITDPERAKLRGKLLGIAE